MLGTLRKHSRSVIIYVVFGVIIVVFVFTFNVASPDAGCGGGGKGAAASLAHVGDTEIDTSALYMGLALSADPLPAGVRPDPASKSALFTLLELSEEPLLASMMLRDPRAQAEAAYSMTRFIRFKGNPDYARFVPDPRGAPPLKAQKVMEDLIETYLISDEALAHGLRVSPEQVRDRITQDFTDSSGKFSKKSYEDWVRYNLRTSLAHFEEFVRREVLREKMIGVVTANVTVSDREAAHVAALRKSKRTYEYLEVSPALLADAAIAVQVKAPSPLAAAVPTPAEAEAWLKEHVADAQKYYAEHLADFRVDSTFDFHFMKFAAASKRMMGSVTDDEQKKAMDASRSDAKTRAEAAAKAIGTGAVQAFEATAKASSDDKPTAARGGRVERPLPERDVRAMDPDVLGALGKLKPGEASGVIEGDDAFWVVLLDATTPGRDRLFDEVKADVARRVLATEKATKAAETVAAEVLKAAEASPTASLADVASRINAPFAPATPVKYGDTGEIPGVPESLAALAMWQPSEVPGLGESAELASALHGLTVAKPLGDRVYTVAGTDARYIVRLKAESVGEAPTPDEVAAASRELLQVKRLAYYREWYKGVRTAAAVQGRLVEREALASFIREEARAAEETAKQKTTKKDGKQRAAPSPEPPGE